MRKNSKQIPPLPKAYSLIKPQAFPWDLAQRYMGCTHSKAGQQSGMLCGLRSVSIINLICRDNIFMLSKLIQQMVDAFTDFQNTKEVCSDIFPKADMAGQVFLLTTTWR